MVDRVILSITISSSKFDDVIVQVNRYLSFLNGQFLEIFYPRCFIILTHLGPLFMCSSIFHGFDVAELFPCAKKLRGFTDAAQSKYFFLFFFKGFPAIERVSFTPLSAVSKKIKLYEL